LPSIGELDASTARYHIDVVEAVERMVSYDEWFLREVDKGLAAAARGELVDHAEVRKLIDQRYPG